jgi:membrane-bound ClpP family serine protease
MMPFIFLLIGLLLIFLEFFLPGGVMGASGGVFFLVALISFTMNSESALFVVLFYLLAAVSLAVVIKFALWRLKNSSQDSGIYSNNDQEGFHSPIFEKDAIGKEGTAYTDLKPSGYILVEGKRYQAISQSGYVEAKSPVSIVNGKGAYLIVKRIVTKEDAE